MNANPNWAEIFAVKKKKITVNSFSRYWIG
jgi:hypothetical protein